MQESAGREWNGDGYIAYTTYNSHNIAQCHLLPISRQLLLLTRSMNHDKIRRCGDSSDNVVNSMLGEPKTYRRHFLFICVCFLHSLGQEGGCAV